MAVFAWKTQPSDHFRLSAGNRSQLWFLQGGNSQRLCVRNLVTYPFALTKTRMKDFRFRLFCIPSFPSESCCSPLIIRNDDRNGACFTTVSHIPWKRASRPLSSRCTAIMWTLEIGGAGLKRETKSRRFALCRKNVLVRHPRRGASSSFDVNWLLSRLSMNRVALSAREFFWNEYAYDHPFHWIICGCPSNRQIVRDVTKS